MSKTQPITEDQAHAFLRENVGNESGWYAGRTFVSDGFFERSPYQDEADRIGVPVIPARIPEKLDPSPVIAICGACGRKVHQIESYSCGQANCPIQPRAVF